MIAKHVPMRSLGRSSFRELVKYITDEQQKAERVGHITATNCEAVAPLGAVVAEVLATQKINTRAEGDKTYHLLVSFRAGERPDADTLKAIEERICAGLGFGEHQRVSAVHHDTDNLHIHIAINKVHPTRYTLHEPYQAYRKLGELCAVLEREYGLEQDNHQAHRRIAEGRAADMERHAGIESLIGWIKRECLEELRGAATWDELHARLHENGLMLRERGNGFVIEAPDGTMVKASTLSRDLSKPRLEGRLGPFELHPDAPAEGRARRQYRKDPLPLRVDTVELYAQYQDDRKRLEADRTAAWGRARAEKDRRIEAAKRANRLRRAAIKLMSGNRLTKKLLYAQAYKSLRSELQSIGAEYQQKRAEIAEQYQRRTWADWLRHKALEGDTTALAALRAREAAQGLRGETLTGEGTPRPGYAATVDNITKKGTIIYRAGASAIRDDGDKLQLSRAVTHETLQEALRLAAARYGPRLTVNGSATFKAQAVRAAVAGRLQITFADPALERARQQLSATMQEQTHDRRDDRQQDRGRADSRGAGLARSGGAAHHDRRAGGLAPGRGGVHSAGGAAKPDVGRVGGTPPPQNRNRLRALSQLGVVRIAGGSEVLLPRDVPGHVEQQGAQRDHELRRGIFGPGVTADHAAAADKYIAERMEKRLKGFDIPLHSRYTDGVGTLAYAGTRQIDGHPLALLRRDDEVYVLPVDVATARRLKRLTIGSPVTVTARGSIRTTGRTRR